MHELAGCRVSTPTGDVAGYVLGYEGGVLRMQTDAQPSGLRVGEPVDVTVLDPVRGVCTYTGVAGTIGAMADGTALDVVVLEDVARHQRRAAARAPYRFSCVAVLEGGDPPRTLRVTVLDVSATGARFLVAEDLREGAVLRIGLPTGDEVLDLRLRVVRHEVSTTGTRYGAMLVDAQERTRDALYRLVLRLQREQARSAAAHR